MAGVAVLALPGCSPDENSTPRDVLRLGVLPSEQAETLRDRYRPLTEYLAREMNQEIELVIPDSYGHLVRLFGSGAVDMANFGGATFVSAAARHDAVPLVTRDIDAEFSTYFLARAEGPQSRIEDFAGQDFAFGSELSTSGHLMPRHFLQERGLVPEDFFASVRYSGGHDRTVSLVRNRQVSLGAVNRETVKAMLRDGRLAPGELRVVWETPPYADYVWAMQPGWEESYVDRLRDAFLALSPADAEDASILSGLRAGGFLPAHQRDYDSLRKVMAGLPQFKTLLAAEPQ